MFGCRKTFRWRKFVWNSERTLHIVWLSKSTSSRRNNCSKGQTPIYILMRMKKEQLKHLYYYSMHERLINWNNRSLYIFRERERESRLTLGFLCSPVICMTESVVSVFLQSDIFCCGPVSRMPYLYRPALLFCILNIKHTFNL